jgi:predicted Zn-dependent peptidase
VFSAQTERKNVGYLVQLLKDCIEHATYPIHEKRLAAQAVKTETELAYQQAEFIIQEKLHELGFQSSLGNRLLSDPNVFIKHKDLIDFYNSGIRSQAGISVVALNFGHDELVGMAKDILSPLNQYKDSVDKQPAEYFGGNEYRGLNQFTDESFLQIGWKGFSVNDAEFPAYLVFLALLNTKTGPYGQHASFVGEVLNNLKAKDIKVNVKPYFYTDNGLFSVRFTTSSKENIKDSVKDYISKAKEIESSIDAGSFSRAKTVAKVIVASRIDDPSIYSDYIGLQVRFNRLV